MAVVDMGKGDQVGSLYSICRFDGVCQVQGGEQHDRRATPVLQLIRERTFQRVSSVG